MTSASQTKVPMSTAGQTGRVVTMVSPSTASGTSQKLQGNGVAVNSSTVPTAVVSAAHIQTSPQTKVLMHVTGQMTVNQARNAVRTGKRKNYNNKKKKLSICSSIFVVNKLQDLSGQVA